MPKLSIYSDMIIRYHLTIQFITFLTSRIATDVTVIDDSVMKHIARKLYGTNSGVEVLQKTSWKTVDSWEKQSDEAVNHRNISVGVTSECYGYCTRICVGNNVTNKGVWMCWWHQGTSVAPWMEPYQEHPLTKWEPPRVHIFWPKYSRCCQGVDHTFVSF